MCVLNYTWSVRVCVKLHLECVHVCVHNSFYFSYFCTPIKYLDGHTRVTHCVELHCIVSV